MLTCVTLAQKKLTGDRSDAEAKRLQFPQQKLTSTSPQDDTEQGMVRRIQGAQEEAIVDANLEGLL